MRVWTLTETHCFLFYLHLVSFRDPVTAQNYADYLRKNSWLFGKCGDDIVIVVSKQDKQVSRRLSSGKRWKLICELYHYYYASVEEHQKQYVHWKAWLFKCFHILNMACNNIQIGTDFYATCSCSPIYIFLCTVLLTLTWLGQISYNFDDSRTLQYIPILIIMLDDQSFLIDSTTSLLQCNRMARTGLYIKTNMWPIHIEKGRCWKGWQ